MNNIILIGMPGSGKSTLGVLLAKTLGYSFIDSDLIIQKREGRKLQDIIETEGISGFIKAESAAVCSLEAESTVIATGGSVILDDAGMAHLKSLGRVVYLKYSPKEIERRVRNIKTRGIVMAKGETIYDVYNTRAPLYQKYADVVVPLTRAPIEASLEKVTKALQNS